MAAYRIRKGEDRDLSLIFAFIKNLAEYEKMSDQVLADEDLLYEWLFEKKIAEVYFLMEGEKEVAFVLFFHNFSTFQGRAGLYVEDIFVLPEYRGHGYGKALFQWMAKIAMDRGCSRMEWTCLHWNEPSIRFYRSLGAVPMDQWILFRLTGPALEELGKGSADER